jgi:hypothetical protein
MNRTGMGKDVCEDAHIKFLFRCDIYRSVDGFVEAAKEVIFESSNAIRHMKTVCVWGFAISRSGN